MAIFSNSKSNSGALSNEDLDAFDASSGKMGAAIVSYLKSIVGDVNAIMDIQRKGFDSTNYETMFGKAFRSSQAGINEKCHSTDHENKEPAGSVDHVEGQERKVLMRCGF